MFQFGEDLFDRVEVGGIGRQEQKPGSASPDGAAHRLALVAAEIVHHDNVALSQRRDQYVLNIDPEAFAIDWPVVEHPWRIDAVAAQGGRIRRNGREWR